jgi:hypothetical protein
VAVDSKMDPSEDLGQIIESARRLGVELNESEALQWLADMAASKDGGDVVVDINSGAFGHRVSMLDFSPKDMERFKKIGKIVEIEDRPGVVESALALSGSAAQSKIQTYPGDCDYFERVNIIAPTREEACSILADVMREKALTMDKGPTYQFMEAKLGSFPFDCTVHGQAVKKGSPASWTIGDIRAGFIEATTADGTSTRLEWEKLAAEPGWCKLDWVVTDPDRGRLSNASNVLDVTWEAPDGSITPLDGYLDSYFQEVYLDAASIPIFSKVVKHVSADALEEYVKSLEHEVHKYLVEHPNYGKAAKRMYNVFRLTGRYPEAAYIRELFDEPATILYQVWSLLHTIDSALEPSSSIPLEQVEQQADQLVVMAVEALEGDREAEVVKSLVRLRESLATTTPGDGTSDEIEGARAQVVNVINNFFQDRLTALPTVKEYIAGIQARQ